MHYPLSLLTKSSSILNEIYGQLQAVKLAGLSARPSTICALTGLSQRQVKKIILAITKSASPKGRNIKVLDDYIKNKKHCRHVSFIIQTYRKGINLGLTHVEAIIQSYMLYLDTLEPFSEPRSFVHIDHAYFLIQETNKGVEFDMSVCSCCKSNFFYYKYELPLICPFCSDKREQKQVHEKHDQEQIRKAA